jgi:UPF0755 protein
MKFLRGLIVLCLAMGAFIGWLTYEYYSAPWPMTAETIVTVTAGDSLRGIGQDLYNKQVIPSVQTFVMWARLFRHDRNIKTGEYAIPTNTSMAGLFKILRSGKSIGYKVVVPEGSNMYEVAKFLEDANLCMAGDFLKIVTNRKFVKAQLDEDAASLEGYLFPDTYFFTKVDGCRLIAAKMVQRFKDKVLRVPPPPGWSRKQFVTLASIIEKETGAPFERGKISSVFHNRLQKGMRLQTDPTVMYAKILRTGEPDNNISKADLQTDHPYNTYMRKGLPPGPISNPGLEALDAAAHPENTPYLFFVSKNDGTHVFTSDYKDHNAAVGAYQLNAKARAGHSWRELKTKPAAGTGASLPEAPAPVVNQTSTPTVAPTPAKNKKPQTKKVLPKKSAKPVEPKKLKFQNSF